MNGGSSSLLVVVGAPAARRRVALLGRRRPLGRGRLLTLAQRAAGVGEALVDQAVEVPGEHGGVADPGLGRLDGAEHRHGPVDEGLGRRRQPLAVGRQAEGVLKERLDHRLGVGEGGQLGPVLGARGLDHGHVAADPRVGPADGGIDAVALDDVEQVAGQGRLGEERVEAGEVGLEGPQGRHGASAA